MEARDLGAPYAWFLASGLTWFGAWGMQQVIFAWLVVDVLNTDAALVGTAQMVQMLPSVLFLLIGGALADRAERRTTLFATHAVAALAAGALIGAVLADRLTFAWLLVYAATWGTLQAIHLPARDSLLFDVGSQSLARAVSGATLVQFVGQAAGNILVGTAAWLGAPIVLSLNAGMLVAGLPAIRKLPVGKAPRELDRRSTLHEIREGMRLVIRSTRLRTLAMLASYNGLFFVSSYVVLVPILVRDVYQGGVGELSLVMMMFPLGAVSGSIWLLLYGAPRRRGRAHLLGQLGGALCLIGISTTPPFPITLLIVYGWGVCGGFFLNMGRTLFLEAAPHTHRGRVLSVYALALLGVAPLGSQMAGVVAGVVGPSYACLFAGISMCALLAATALLIPSRSFD